MLVYGKCGYCMSCIWSLVVLVCTDIHSPTGTGIFAELCIKSQAFLEKCFDVSPVDLGKSLDVGRVSAV